jgi:hypothetical protein
MEANEHLAGRAVGSVAEHTVEELVHRQHGREGGEGADRRVGVCKARDASFSGSLGALGRVESLREEAPLVDVLAAEHACGAGLHGRDASVEAAVPPPGPGWMTKRMSMTGMRYR